jgi:hypothetical protein
LHVDVYVTLDTQVGLAEMLANRPGAYRIDSADASAWPESRVTVVVELVSPPAAKSLEPGTQLVQAVKASVSPAADAATGAPADMAAARTVTTSVRRIITSS